MSIFNEQVTLLPIVFESIGFIIQIYISRVPWLSFLQCSIAYGTFDPITHTKTQFLCFFPLCIEHPYNHFGISFIHMGIHLCSKNFKFYVSINTKHYKIHSKYIQAVLKGFFFYRYDDAISNKNRNSYKHNCFE
jgi:hypothetical protein